MIAPYIKGRKYITAHEYQLKGWFQWIDMKKSQGALGGFGIVALSFDNDLEDYIEARRRLRYKIMGYDGIIQ